MGHFLNNVYLQENHMTIIWGGYLRCIEYLSSLVLGIQFGTTKGIETAHHMC